MKQWVIYKTVLQACDSSSAAFFAFIYVLLKEGSNAFTEVV